MVRNLTTTDKQALRLLLPHNVYLSFYIHLHEWNILEIVYIPDTLSLGCICLHVWSRNVILKLFFTLACQTAPSIELDQYFNCAINLLLLCNLNIVWSQSDVLLLLSVALYMGIIPCMLKVTVMFETFVRTGKVFVPHSRAKKYTFQLSKPIIPITLCLPCILVIQEDTRL